MLEATPIEPRGPPGRFERLRDGFSSKRGEFDLPALVDLDEAAAVAAIRRWLHRVVGPATDDVEFVRLRFDRFTQLGEGFIALRQLYRGIETPGSFLLMTSRGDATAYVNLYEISPTSDPPARVISPTAASDAADAMLRETPNAMSRRVPGDRPLLQYALAEGQSARDRSGRNGASAHWDVVWMFRLPTEFRSHAPIVNARTGFVTVYVCGTGLPDPSDAEIPARKR